MEVDPSDFAEGMRRDLAEIYWRRQREEGEPVFSEFLDSLQAGLKELAAQLAHQAGLHEDPQASVKAGVDFLRRRRAQMKDQGRQAQLRVGGCDEAALLEQISESSRVPDPRRLAVPYGA
jgi:hypothetical protein